VLPMDAAGGSKSCRRHSTLRFAEPTDEGGSAPAAGALSFTPACTRASLISEEADEDDESASEEGSDEAGLEDEIAQLHERLVQVTSDLVQERHRAASLQRTVDEQRKKLMTTSALSRMQLVSKLSLASALSRGGEDGGAETDDDGASSEGSVLPDGPSAEAAAFARRAAKRKAAADKLEREQEIERLQEEVRRLERVNEEEAAKRHSLEQLRAEFVRRFSLALVTQIERGLEARPVAVGEPAPTPGAPAPRDSVSGSLAAPLVRRASGGGGAPSAATSSSRMLLGLLPSR